MGTWATGIFADDLACDVRDGWRDLIGEGSEPAEATNRILRKYADAARGEESARPYGG